MIDLILYTTTIVGCLIGPTAGALCRCAVMVEDADAKSVPLDNYYQLDYPDVDVCAPPDLKECSDACFDRAIDNPEPFLLASPSGNDPSKTRGSDYCEKIAAMAVEDRPDVGVPGLAASSYFTIDSCPETDGYMSTDPAYFRDYLCCDGTQWITGGECGQFT